MTDVSMYFGRWFVGCVKNWINDTYGILQYSYGKVSM